MISGGAGNDRYVARGTDAPSRVEFDGGFGVDVANYFFATEGVRVGVDGFPFDGRPGDNDRIDRTVETVIGSQYADELIGTQRDQQLLGQEGDDFIAGGDGQDVLVGGRGNDRIDARDGELDSIDCGGWLLDRPGRGVDRRLRNLTSAFVLEDRGARSSSRYAEPLTRRGAGAAERARLEIV